MTLKRHKQFKKDFEKLKINDGQYEKFIKSVSLLLDGKKLPKEARDHSLKGDFKDVREFHIGGDIIVLYRMVIESNGTISIHLLRIGTYNQIFRG